MSAHDVMEGIFTNWSSNSLDSTVTGGLWLSLAPEGTAFPYCVYDIVSNVPRAKMNSSSSSGTEITEIEFQLSLYDDNMSTLGAASKTVRAAYDYADLSLGVGEGDVLQVRLSNEIPQRLEDEIWQWVLIYKVLRSKPYNPSGA